MPKIKMFCALPRRRDISAQAFHDHWRHPHGTLGSTISTVRNYVQSHRIETVILDETQSHYDGIVEVWFDSVDDAIALPDHPAYKRHLVPDEPRFIDMDRIRYVFTNEEILFSGPDASDPSLDAADLNWNECNRATSIKLIQFFSEDISSTRDENYYRELGLSLGAFRHAFCTANDKIHPSTPPFKGVRELWWPTLSAFEAGVSANPNALEKLTKKTNPTSTMLMIAERFK